MLVVKGFSLYVLIFCLVATRYLSCVFVFCLVGLGLFFVCVCVCVCVNLITFVEQ